MLALFVLSVTVTYPLGAGEYVFYFYFIEVFREVSAITEKKTLVQAADLR